MDALGLILGIKSLVLDPVKAIQVDCYSKDHKGREIKGKSNLDEHLRHGRKNPIDRTEET
jgi:hypothetical protein